MTFRFIYCQEIDRVLPGVVLDARVPLGIWQKTGFEQKAYFDAELAKITPDVLPYKIETENGTLAGYFTLKTGNMGQTATLFQITLRPAFQQFSGDIKKNISIFVNGSSWKSDILLPN